VGCSTADRELTMRIGASIYVDPVSAPVLGKGPQRGCG